MSEQPNDSIWNEVQVPIKDVVTSNSWALQAILLYLEEQNPGARDRIWQIYSQMKAEAERTQQSSSSSNPSSETDSPESGDESN